ncbi:MAG: hypothetical protein NTV93_12865 [Verrucomicrobia bacterium]|nr:hypothetical protein [Verrucomicrobiota bacterium]
MQKVRACVGAAVGPGSWADWVPGGWGNRGSLPVDYELRGVLLAPIRVGEPISVYRTWRNGVSTEGMFLSTAIREIASSGEILTSNSVYRIAALQAAGCRN